MQDLPAPSDLVALAAAFLREEIMPELSGAKQFQLRVAINALDLCTRQLRTAADMAQDEYTRLHHLLGEDASLDELNRILCDAIASGSQTLETPGLADHLWATTMDKLAVDQPNYAAYKRERARDT